MTSANFVSWSSLGGGGRAGAAVGPWLRAVLFVDNAGADVVLGMLPLARELLLKGAEVLPRPLSSPRRETRHTSRLPAESKLPIES